MEPVEVRTDEADGPVEGEPSHESCGEYNVDASLAPFSERRVGSVVALCPLLTGSDEIERQVSAAGLDTDTPHLLKVQQGVLALETGERLDAHCLDDLVDQGRGAARR